MKTIGHLINGKTVAEDPRHQDLINPSTNEKTARVSLASKATVEEAITAAADAYPTWRDVPPIKRARIMFRLKDLLEQNADKICELLTREHGKVLNDALGELQRGIENVEYACGVPELLKGEHSRNVGCARTVKR